MIKKNVLFASSCFFMFLITSCAANQANTKNEILDNGCGFTMDTKAVYTFHLDMPREKAWEKLRDLTLAPNYVPGVTGVQITTEKKDGVGASRCILPKKMDETVVEWNEGYGFVLKLHKGEYGPPAPFKEACFIYSMKDDESRTEFTMALIYKMRMGVLGRLIDRLFINFYINGFIKDVGLSLKHFYETNEPVTPDILKNIKA